MWLKEKKIILISVILFFYKDFSETNNGMYLLKLEFKKNPTIYEHFLVSFLNIS